MPWNKDKHQSRSFHNKGFCIRPSICRFCSFLLQISCFFLLRIFHRYKIEMAENEDYIDMSISSEDEEHLHTEEHRENEECNGLEVKNYSSQTKTDKDEYGSDVSKVMHSNDIEVHVHDQIHDAEKTLEPVAKATDQGAESPHIFRKPKARKTDVSSGSGNKRPRLSYVDDQPYVQIIYNHLSRESKKKLTELLQKWSEWHSHQENLHQEPLESGDEIFFPALQVGQGNGTLLTFWMDKPSNQVSKENVTVQADEGSVPYYDRACLAPLAIHDDDLHSECIDDIQPESSRCFNCGSYAHSLKECTKPRDNAAINNARSQHKAKRASVSGPRNSQRYYQDTPGGKFDGIKPGILGPETRQSLGIGEFDPPPWLQRMRELGYPPGYLEASDEEEEPSGIVIFSDKGNTELEEGEITATENCKTAMKKKMSVEFPGINAPIPENADRRHWHRSGSERAYGSASSSSHRSRLDHYHEQRRAVDYNSYLDEPPPPGTEHMHNNHAHSSDYTLRSSHAPNFPNKYSGTSMSRSSADNGRWAPSSSHDTSAKHNSRYGEHGRSSYRPHSPHGGGQYSTSSSGRYSPHQSPRSEQLSSDRRHGRYEDWASDKPKRDRSEGGRHHHRS